jgi:hypothetical protein
LIGACGGDDGGASAPADDCASLCKDNCTCIVGTTTGDIYKGCIHGCTTAVDGHCSEKKVCENAAECQQLKHGSSTLTCSMYSTDGG